jgi:hypothetical protein
MVTTAAPVPPPKAEAPNSDFRAIIGGTIQYAHSDIWTHTLASTGPLVPMAGEVVRGQRLDLVISFGGFAVDRDGQGDVVYDLTVARPDGATRVVGTNLVAFHGTVPALHMMHVTAESAYLIFEKEDPAGTYRFIAKLKDRIGHTEVEVSGEVNVLDREAEKPLPADFDLKKMSEWLMHYYEHPEPRLALPVLRFAAHDRFMAAHPGAWPALLGTYEMILRDNPWLAAQFQARLLAIETDKAEQDRLLYVLAYVFRANSAFGQFLPPHMREDFRADQQQRWPDPDQELFTGSQLDVMWGRFFGTGAFAPIQGLVSALEYHKYHGSIEAFKKLDPKPAVAPPEVQREAIYRAAVWSLKANAIQHKLVYDYLAYLMNDSKTGSDNAPQIAVIIGAKIKMSDGKVIDPNNPPASGAH